MSETNQNILELRGEISRVRHAVLVLARAQMASGALTEVQQQTLGDLQDFLLEDEDTFVSAVLRTLDADEMETLREEMPDFFEEISSAAGVTPENFLERLQAVLDTYRNVPPQSHFQATAYADVMRLVYGLSITLGEPPDFWDVRVDYNPTAQKLEASVEAHALRDVPCTIVEGVGGSPWTGTAQVGEETVQVSDTCRMGLAVKLAREVRARRGES
jgi:hypothetical protein